MTREPFEKWLFKEHGLQSEWQPERNCYKDFPAHLAWKAWQAAPLPEGRTEDSARLDWMDRNPKVLCFGYGIRGPGQATWLHQGKDDCEGHKSLRAAIDAAMLGGPQNEESKDG